MEVEEVEEYLPKKERDALPDDVFAGPDRTYPCDTQAHVDAAATLYGRADNPDEVKRNIIRIAKEKGFSIPKAWQDEGSTAKESSQSASPFAPKARIATLTTRFLKNGAQSLNGRIYPRETVERLVASAQVAISNPNAPMLTCYTSHDAADRQDPINLAGRITRVWQEGEDAYAKFDIPDTTAGRDMVALVSGGYLKTMSLRAKNAELKLEKGYPLPIVTGSPQLEGIDYAPTPGLPDVALIQQVTVESVGDTLTLIETFALDAADVVLETAPENETITLNEQKPPDAADATPTGDAMVDALISLMDTRAKQAINESLPDLKANIQQAHDHVAEMLSMPCSTSGKAKEAGRSISKANGDKLGAAHDALAMALGTECRYDPDMDGDNDSTDDPALNPDAQQDQAQGMDEHQTTKGDTQDMTREELLAQLQAEGFTVAAPKSAEEKAQEALEARLAEMQTQFEAKLTETLSKLVPAAPATQTPARKTMVEGANVGRNAPANPKIYRHGNYLKEKLLPTAWPELADRSQPLPEGISPSYLVKEFSELLSGIIEENYV